ncbi:pirin family protein [Flavisolibacter sp. BT320]|nr:pirin family protein [Flavisolibacter longurius]
MKSVLYKAATRGHANYGWLDTWHTFSFGNYHDPNRLHFGALRVLNDDTVAPGAGFGKHRHENMEIITIPLKGELEHEDSMGNRGVISPGDVQVMSAGTGIEHSEKNVADDFPVSFLQIWIFPEQNDLAPRYEQRSFTKEEKQNRFLTVVSPMDAADNGVRINQQAWLSLGHLDAGTTHVYNLKKGDNGVYAFLIIGDVTVNDIVLNQRDGLGLSETNHLSIMANTNAEILLLEVPVETSFSRI